MTEKTKNIFSDEEKDILQELMNIAFGKAAADLAQVVDIFINLSIPKIQIVNIGDMPDYIKNEMNDSRMPGIVNQKFWGDLSGSGVLVFPNKSGENLATILEDDSAQPKASNPIVTQEIEILMEIGNILIGACVGKISELLNTFVTYSPPQVIIENSDDCGSFFHSYDPHQAVIAMKTLFSFKEKNINGFLLILTSQESINWLRNALHEFMNGYE